MIHSSQNAENRNGHGSPGTKRNATFGLIFRDGQGRAAEIEDGKEDHPRTGVAKVVHGEGLAVEPPDHDVTIAARSQLLYGYGHRAGKDGNKYEWQYWPPDSLEGKPPKRRRLVGWTMVFWFILLAGLLGYAAEAVGVAQPWRPLLVAAVLAVFFIPLI